MHVSFIAGDLERIVGLPCSCDCFMEQGRVIQQPLLMFL